MAPSVTNCHVNIYAGYSPGTVVASSDCAPDGVEPLPVWLSTATPSKIRVSYQTDFAASYTTPDVNYVQNSPIEIGIALATFAVQHPDGRGEKMFLSCVIVQFLLF